MNFCCQQTEEDLCWTKSHRGRVHVPLRGSASTEDLLSANIHSNLFNSYAEGTIVATNIYFNQV